MQRQIVHLHGSEGAGLMVRARTHTRDEAKHEVDNIRVEKQNIAGETYVVSNLFLWFALFSHALSFSCHSIKKCFLRGGRRGAEY